MSMFDTNENQVKIFRNAVRFAIFCDDKGTTVKDLVQAAATKEEKDTGDTLPEDHPLALFLAYLAGANPDYQPTDAMEAIAGLDIRQMIGFAPSPDLDLIKRMQTRIGQILTSGDLFSREDLAKAVADGLNKPRNPWFDLNFDAAIVEVYKDDRVSRYNGEREQMGGKGRWSFLGMPEYQVTAAS